MTLKLYASLLPLAVAFVLFTPHESAACPICFGDPDSPVARGVNWAVFTLMGVTGGVLSGFVGFILHLMKRSRLALGSEAESPGESWGPGGGE